jgi:hypothetical protein
MGSWAEKEHKLQALFLCCLHTVGFPVDASAQSIWENPIASVGFLADAVREYGGIR